MILLNLRKQMNQKKKKYRFNMYQITQKVDCNFCYKVFIEKVKITKITEPVLNSNGEPIIKKNGARINRTKTYEQILDRRIETYLSKYNAQSRVESVNFDNEERSFNGVITRARMEKNEKI